MVLFIADVVTLAQKKVSGLTMQARRNIPTIPQPAETIRLVKAFLLITCAVDRQRLIEYAESVAAEHSKIEIINFTAEDDEPDV